MASYIKTLKEDNGDITYPQTLASAVFIGNSDVETELGKYVTAEDIASTSALSPVVSTSMIQDEAITAAKIDSDVLSGMGSYSTSEQATPFTWIDGSTIYKKTVSNTFSSIPASGIVFNHGISNFSKLIKTDVAFNLGWDTSMWGDGSYLARNSIGVRITSAQVCLDRDAASNWSGTVYVTIYYTKSA